MLFISSVVIVLLLNFGITNFKKFSYQKDLKEDVLDAGIAQQQLDNGKVVQLTKNEAPQREPKISGNKIIYKERSSARNIDSLVLFDLETNKKIKIDDLENPNRKNSSGRLIIGYSGEAIFGDNVYWVKDNKLMEYNYLSEKTRTILSEISYVYDANNRYIIGDKGIKFPDGSETTTGKPFIYDILRKTEKEIVLAKKSSEASFGNLKLRGGMVSFIIYRPFKDIVYDLYVYDIELDKFISMGYIDNSLYDFDGSKVVFIGQRNQEDKYGELLMFSQLSDDSLVNLNTPAPFDIEPIISNDIIIYSRVKDNIAEVVLYNLINKQEKIIDSFINCVDRQNIVCVSIPDFFDIDGDLLVWSDERNAQNYNYNSDIFLYKIR